MKLVPRLLLLIFFSTTHIIMFGQWTDTGPVMHTSDDIGIGTASPAKNLSISDVSNAGIGLRSDGTSILEFRSLGAPPFSDEILGDLSYSGNTLTLQSFNGIAQNGDLSLRAEDKVILYAENSFRFISPAEPFVLTRMTILANNGNVGIGTSNPNFKLDVWGDADITGELTAASDLKIKKNIAEIDEALNMVSLLKPVSYDFRTEEFPEMELSERRKMGLIAQDVEAVLPTLVSNAGSITKANGDVVDIKSVNYMELIPLLIKSIQELNNEVEALKEQLNNLQN